MYRVTPLQTVTKLVISMSGKGEGSTRAMLPHEVTALGEPGEEFLKVFTHEWHTAFMKDWEGALNHYLNTGVMIAQ